jgi:hypothetical protein
VFRATSGTREILAETQYQVAAVTRLMLSPASTGKEYRKAN